MEKLTPVEAQVLRGLKNFHAQNGFYPTMRELADFIGQSSFSNMPKYFRALENKGHMIRHSGSSPRLEFPDEMV